MDCCKSAEKFTQKQKHYSDLVLQFRRHFWRHLLSLLQPIIHNLVNIRFSVIVHIRLESLSLRSTPPQAKDNFKPSNIHYMRLAIGNRLAEYFAGKTNEIREQKIERERERKKS